jgi:hypothetical protein
MSNPMPIRIIPPAILNAGNVMPNILKIKLPASANEHSTIVHVIAERLATARRSSFGELAVTAKNMGITANGSTRKNTEVSASNANSSTEVIVGIEVSHEPRAPKSRHNMASVAARSK